MAFDENIGSVDKELETQMRYTIIITDKDGDDHNIVGLTRDDFEIVFRTLIEQLNSNKVVLNWKVPEIKGRRLQMKAISTGSVAMITFEKEEWEPEEDDE